MYKLEDYFFVHAGVRPGLLPAGERLDPLVAHMAINDGLKTAARNLLQDESLIQTTRRETRLKAVDMKAYESLVEETLKKIFDTDVTLKKIHRGEEVTEADLQKLVSLV